MKMTIREFMETLKSLPKDAKIGERVRLPFKGKNHRDWSARKGPPEFYLLEFRLGLEGWAVVDPTEITFVP